MPDQSASHHFGVPDPIGLCAICRHARVVQSARGSTFYLCRLAESDPRFAKYPRLPVLRCVGYEPAAESEDASFHPAGNGEMGKTGTIA
jgi:hypothetical protein